MKVSYKTHDESLVAELEGEDQKSLFEQLSKFQEVFDHEPCGKCKCKNNLGVKFQVRVVDDNTYYEKVCRDPGCLAKLPFGCHKKGGSLFPKRRDDQGNIVGGYGWVIYNKKTGKEE